MYVFYAMIYLQTDVPFISFRHFERLANRAQRRVNENEIADGSRAHDIVC